MHGLLSHQVLLKRQLEGRRTPTQHGDDIIFLLSLFLFICPFDELLILVDTCGLEIAVCHQMLDNHPTKEERLGAECPLE